MSCHGIARSCLLWSWSVMVPAQHGFLDLVLRNGTINKVLAWPASASAWHRFEFGLRAQKRALFLCLVFVLVLPSIVPSPLTAARPVPVLSFLRFFSSCLFSLMRASTALSCSAGTWNPLARQSRMELLVKPAARIPRASPRIVIHPTGAQASLKRPGSGPHPGAGAGLSSDITACQLYISRCI